MKTLQKLSKVGFLLGIGLVFAFGLSACRDPGEAVVPKRPAPAFELKDPAGRVFRLEDFKGSVTIVHFWATWCPPCIEEIPRWIAGAENFKDLPVKLVAISVDETWEKALRVFPKDQVSSRVLLLLDPTSEVAGKWGTRQFPESYVVNRDLQITEKWIGSQDWAGSMVRFGVAKALAHPGVSAAGN